MGKYDVPSYDKKPRRRRSAVNGFRPLQDRSSVSVEMGDYYLPDSQVEAEVAEATATEIVHPSTEKSSLPQRLRVPSLVNMSSIDTVPTIRRSISNPELAEALELSKLVSPRYARFIIDVVPFVELFSYPKRAYRGGLLRYYGEATLREMLDERADFEPTLAVWPTSKDVTQQPVEISTGAVSFDVRLRLAAVSEASVSAEQQQVTEAYGLKQGLQANCLRLGKVVVEGLGKSAILNEIGSQASHSVDVLFFGGQNDALFPIPLGPVEFGIEPYRIQEQ